MLDSLSERFKTYAPVAYVVLVILGLLYKASYYAEFSIDILNYIDLSESIFFLFNTLLNAIGFSMLGVLAVATPIQMLLSLFFVIWSTIKKKEYDVDIAIRNVTLILGTIIFFLSIARYNPINCLAAYIGALLYAMPKSQKSKLNIRHAGLVMIFFVFFLPISARRLANEVKVKGQQVEIKFTDPETNTQQLGKILIGENKNYIFLYSRKDSLTTSLSRTQIQYIRVKNLRHVDPIEAEIKALFKIN